MIKSKYFFFIILSMIICCSNVKAEVIVDGKNIAVSGENTYLYGIYDDRTSLNIEATDAAGQELEIIGNKNLQVGINKITIGKDYVLLVYKEDNTYKKYTNNVQIKENTFLATSINQIIDGNFSKLNTNKFVYDYTDANGGLLSKYTFTNKTSDTKSFIPAIISTDQEKHYYISNLPANTNVMYYIGDLYKNEKVYVFSLDADGGNLKMLKQTKNELGYIEFTTDGKSTLLIANTKDLNKETIKVTKTTVVIIEITIILILMMLIVIKLIK